MAKRMYIGVDSKARKVKKMYVGVNGVARKVKKGYIGVNGVARLFFSADPVYSAITNHPGGYPNAIAAMDGALYTFGYNFTENTTASYKYTISTGTWTQIANNPCVSGSYGALAAGAYNGAIYIYGGKGTLIYSYNPSANSYTKVASVSGLSNYYTGINGYSWIFHEGYFYCCRNASSTSATLKKISTSGAATDITLPSEYFGKSNAVLAGYNGYIYVFGGTDDSSNGSITTACKVNISTSTVTTIASLPLSLAGAGACALDGGIYIVGGYYATNASSGDDRYYADRTALYRYDIATNTYTTVQTTGVNGCYRSAALGSKGYVLGHSYFGSKRITPLREAANITIEV